MKFAATLATAALILSLPLVVYYLYYCLAFRHGELAIPSLAVLTAVPVPTATSGCIVLGWIAFQALLQIYAPGPWVEGSALADGTRLRYRMNGWSAWWLSWLAIIAGVAGGLVPPTVLADRFGELLSVAIVIAVIFSGYLYWHGGHGPAREPRPTTSAICNFWLGNALNPRLGLFDLKLFCEARPGLIGWIAIDLSFAAKQIAIQGHLTIPMVLVCACQFWYVADYYFHEEAILTTWDIKYENFGFMLCFGDFVWVPFTYTVQAFYLVERGDRLPWWAAALIVALNVVGYWIFRGANLQKHRFRKNPQTPVWGRPAEYIRTARGSLLLYSGWWGLSRHMNYCGDLLMGLAWCLPCQLGSPLPYFYFIYFTILLVHRERRDNRMCTARYGADWEAYCARVPYRIVPGLY